MSKSSTSSICNAGHKIDTKFIWQLNLLDWFHLIVKILKMTKEIPSNVTTFLYHLHLACVHGRLCRALWRCQIYDLHTPRGWARFTRIMAGTLTWPGFAGAQPASQWRKVIYEGKTQGCDLHAYWNTSIQDCCAPCSIPCNCVKICMTSFDIIYKIYHCPITVLIGRKYVILSIYLKEPCLLTHSRDS